MSNVYQGIKGEGLRTEDFTLLCLILKPEYYADITRRY